MYNDSSFAEGYAVGRDANGNGNGWNNGGDWILLLILFAIFGNGFGGFGSNSSRIATQSDVQRGFDTSAIIGKLDGINNGLCDGFYAVNNSLMNGFNGIDKEICNLGYNLQNCCCQTQRAIDSVNYNMATNTCALQNTINYSTRDIIDNQNANYRAIHDELVANKIETKNDRIAELQQQVTALQFSASQQAQNAFITANQEAQTAELIRRLGKDCPTPSFIVPNPHCCYQPNLNNYGGCCNSCGC